MSSHNALDAEKIQQIIEAALLAADGPLTVASLGKLFAEGELDEETASKQIREGLKVLGEEAQARGVELKRVASGYRYQVRQELSEWVSRLWDEKPPRYTRALLETLALVAYKQPVTRGDIEQVRGVSVSQNIMRTLVERDWIRVVGQKEVPGRPSLYGTTKVFLDYFSLKSLDELPPLAEIRELIEPAVVEVATATAGSEAGAEAEQRGAIPEAMLRDLEPAPGDPDAIVAHAAPMDDAIESPDGAVSSKSDEASGERSIEESEPAQVSDDVVQEDSAEAADAAADDSADAVTGVSEEDVSGAEIGIEDVGPDGEVASDSEHQDLEGTSTVVAAEVEIAPDNQPESAEVVQLHTHNQPSS